MKQKLFKEIIKIINNREYNFKELFTLLVVLVFVEYMLVGLEDYARYFGAGIIIVGAIIPVSIFLCYVLLFIYKRFWLDIILSNRCNIVISYDLSGLDNRDKFLKKYDIFYKNLKNDLRFQNLNNKIKIIKAPQDVELDDYLAEKKTTLGLFGATLIVWGRAKKYRNEVRWETRFSYQFSYPPRIFDESRAVEISNNYISRIIGNFFNQNKFSTNINKSCIGNDILLVCLFILGYTTNSFKRFDESLLFFNKFRDEYGKISDLVFKRKLGPAMVEIEKMMIVSYFNKLIVRVSNIKKNIHEIQDICRKVLEINSINYDANLLMAVCCYEFKDMDNAVIFNEKAENSAPNNRYDHVFNRAFFLLLNKKYGDAINVYESIPDDIETNVLSIISFFDIEYELYNNPSFLFAEGYISIKWADVRHGKNVLKNFIKKFNNKGEYDTLIVRARELTS